MSTTHRYRKKDEASRISKKRKTHGIKSLEEYNSNQYHTKDDFFFSNPKKKKRKTQISIEENKKTEKE